MPQRQLTPQELTFVRRFIETGSVDDAAAYAGVEDGRELMATPLVTFETRVRLASRLLQIVPMAISTLENLITDKSVPAAVRRLAASDILARAGLVAPGADEVAMANESLSDMSAAALKTLVARLEGELFARAKPVQLLEIEG